MFWEYKVKSYYKKLIKTRFEYDFLDFILSKRCNNKCKILDVGCGHGQKLKYLNDRGYCVDGVEKNIEIVNQLCSEGYNIYTPEEFYPSEKIYDLIIMSHIIEHFQYNDLKEFIDGYLNRLEKDGFLLVYTPTLNYNFYVDFDHVKPYHPVGIKMVFGGNDAQVQFYSKHSLTLVEFMYRRVPIKISYSRSQLLGQRDYLAFAFNVLMGILYRISFNVISRKTGWAGLFQLTKEQT